MFTGPMKTCRTTKFEAILSVARHNFLLSANTPSENLTNLANFFGDGSPRLRVELLVPD
jgi:hypothetical protein